MKNKFGDDSALWCQCRWQHWSFRFVSSHKTVISAPANCFISMALLPPTPPSLSIPSRLFTRAEAESFHPREVTDGTSSSSENVGKRDIKKKNPPPPHALFLPLLPLKTWSVLFHHLEGHLREFIENTAPSPKFKPNFPERMKSASAVSNSSEEVYLDILIPFQKNCSLSSVHLT